MNNLIEEAGEELEEGEEIEGNEKRIWTKENLEKMRKYHCSCKNPTFPCQGGYDSVNCPDFMVESSPLLFFKLISISVVQFKINDISLLYFTRFQLSTTTFVSLEFSYHNILAPMNSALTSRINNQTLETLP